jgi:hypothetical protein
MEEGEVGSFGLVSTDGGRIELRERASCMKRDRETGAVACGGNDYNKLH